jgi:hypothetical protein
MIQVLKKIRQDNKNFITSEELKKYCEDLYFNYKMISNYLISRGYVINILDNIYYVKTFEEFNQNKINYSVLELVEKALKKMRIKHWYYGLYTALKLINIDYKNEDEYFYIINDKIEGQKLIKILGKEFRFLRFKNTFFNFGILKKKARYSDLEKTILDLIYLWEINHLNETKIIIEISKLLDGILEEKILKYSKYYPKSNQEILKKALEKFS